MYILGENEICIWWDLFKATYQGKVAINLKPEVDVGGEGGGERVQHTPTRSQNLDVLQAHTPSL